MTFSPSTNGIAGSLAQQSIERVNQARIRMGLTPLTPHPLLIGSSCSPRLPKPHSH